jgi:hypothetical protein
MIVAVGFFVELMPEQHFVKVCKSFVFRLNDKNNGQLRQPNSFTESSGLHEK